MAKALTEAEVKAKLYATRPTDYGFKGKFTERAVTGGYTMPPRDESRVRDHDRVIRKYGKLMTPEQKPVHFKPARGSARPHGGYNRDVKAVEVAAIKKVDANLADFFSAKRKAKRAARRERLAAMGR